MRAIIRRALVPVLLILLVALYWAHERGRNTGRLMDMEGRRVFVADGDTVRVGDETIRLAGLDAVERGQFCMDGGGKAWSCGQSARDALEAQLAAGRLRCTTVDRDRYGRIVARCQAGDRDLGGAMVVQGWAVSDGAYDREEDAARQAKRGIWRGTFERPAIWRERNRFMPRQAQPSG